MGSSCKLLWNQSIRGVLRRPSDPAELTGHRDCLRWLHRRNKNTVARLSTTNRRPILELYNYARGNPALSVLGLVAELSHKPICLHQA